MRINSGLNRIGHLACMQALPRGKPLMGQHDPSSWSSNSPSCVTLEFIISPCSIKAWSHMINLLDIQTVTSPNLPASSSCMASVTSRKTTRERVAKPRGAEDRMLLDCEQSLFFFRQCTRARALSGEAARHEKRGRRLQSRAWSFACLGRFARRTKKKERLLGVQNAPVYAQFPPLALASPLACCSRVTSRDFPKWGACSQATTPQYFYNKCIGAALNFKGLTNGGISSGLTSFIDLKSAFIFSLILFAVWMHRFMHNS